MTAESTGASAGAAMAPRAAVNATTAVVKESMVMVFLDDMSPQLNAFRSCTYLKSMNQFLIFSIVLYIRCHVKLSTRIKDFQILELREQAAI